MHATRSWDAHEQAEGPSPLKMLRGYLLRLRHAGPLPARLDPYRRGCAPGGVAGGMWGTVRGEGGGGAGEDGGGGEAWGEDVVGLFRQLHEEHARNIPLDVLSPGEADSPAALDVRAMHFRCHAARTLSLTPPALSFPSRVWRAHCTACRPVADSPAALGVRALYRKMVCSQRGGSCFQVRGLVLPACNTPSRLHLRPRPVHPRHTAGPSNVLLAWVLRHHLACQVDLLPALSCHSPHSPRHHHSPPSSSCRSSRQPPVPAATLNAASPAAAPSSDHAAACVARLSSPADSAQQPVQSARAAASSASAELADHMCLLVHINGMAWLADVSTPCCPSSLLPHPMFLEPLLFQPAIHQAGPSFPSPPISIHYTRPSIPCCDVMCDSHSHPFSLLTQAFPLHATSLSHHPSPPTAPGRGGVRHIPMPSPTRQHLPVQPLGCMDEVRGLSAGGEAHSDSDPDDDDDFYTEGVRGHGTPCPPRLTHAAGGQAASAAAVRAGEQWYVVERLCRVGPSEAGERWAAADGKQAAWGKAACEEEGQWQPLYCFSSWPHDTAHFLQCMRHASPLGGPRVAVRVCSEGEREVEGRGVIREMIRDRHLLLLDGEGRVQSQQQLATDEEFDAVVRGRFGIRLGADDVRAMPPVPREPPLGDVWLASEW
ncbi:unnamed protein product [Closterium sp. NIES-65]|nr:unnamed protein product [Closterium sp. NIES-65]